MRAQSLHHSVAAVKHLNAHRITCNTTTDCARQRQSLTQAGGVHGACAQGVKGDRRRDRVNVHFERLARFVASSIAGRDLDRVLALQATEVAREHAVADTKQTPIGVGHFLATGVQHLHRAGAGLIDRDRTRELRTRRNVQTRRACV